MSKNHKIIKSIYLELFWIKLEIQSLTKVKLHQASKKISYQSYKENYDFYQKEVTINKYLKRFLILS